MTAVVDVDSSRIEAIDLDGIIDDIGIFYIGTAERQADGTWRCLANVGGCLCVVEVKITPKEKES